MYDENNFMEIGFYKKKKNISILFTLFFALMLFNGIKSYYADIVFDYSSSKRLAQFIKNSYINKGEKAIFFSDTINYTVAINYYLDPDNNVYWLKTGKPYKYVVWSKDIIPTFKENDWNYYFKEIRKIDKNTKLFVIQNHNAFWDMGTNLEWKNFELVYISGDSLEYFEKFRLYKYKY